MTEGKKVSLAAQNLHWQESGAFTGEISGAMIKDFGGTHVLIGHSERRQYFGETDETVAKKITAAEKQGLNAIACIGETLAERQSQKTFDVVDQQLKSIIEANQNPEYLVIAYEPVWAIGTGLSATSVQAQEVHGFIRQLLAKRYGKDPAERISILYGGSVKSSNFSELLAQPDIDGGLVGGASLIAEEFAQMANLLVR